MKIGVFGGTFDPIHLGHLAVAEEARTRIKLDEVIFMPAGQPWMKEDINISPAKHRVEMVRLAIEDKPYFKLSTIEVGRLGPTYTIDTLTELLTQRPDNELFLIVGWASLAELPQWRDPGRIMKLCTIIAAPRPGAAKPNLKALEAVVRGLTRKVKMLDRPFMDISATGIRDRVSCGLPVGYLVPKPVEKYIIEHKLYSGEKRGKA